MVTLVFEGEGVAALDQEAGRHRVQRVPDNERRGRVHSSTVSVAVLNQAAPITPVRVAVADCKIEWYSGSGAGGQHRNKHPNCARITHLPTGLVRTAQTRSRANSQQLALAALEEALNQQALHTRATERQTQRVAQIGTTQEGERDRVWAFQRDRVEDGKTGRSVRIKDAWAGRLEGLWSPTA